MDYKHGFIHEPAEEYHKRRLDVASNGGLVLLDTTTPLHYHHWITNPEPDEAESAALKLGKAYHCAVLEPEVFAETYCIIPADAPRDLRRFRDAKKPSQETLDSIDWWDGWEAENAGRIMLAHDVRERIIAMATAQRSMRLSIGGVTFRLAELIDVCEKEVSAYWQDEVSGVHCKARFDLLERDLGFCGDLKTARDAGKEAFARSAAGHRYHQQQAHYCEGFRALVGRAPAAFSFLPIEKEPPYAPAAWHLGAASHELGYGLQQRALAKLAGCLKNNRWPGYPETVAEIELPTWAHYELESKTA